MFVRFTVSGDTVLGVGVESTMIPEVALGRARRLELYLGGEHPERDVTWRIEKAHTKAFANGMFKVCIKTLRSSIK